MDIYINEKIRVCWHEIGHFVAAYYNQIHYGGFGTEAIRLRREPTINGRFQYGGFHDPIKPPNYDRNSPIKHPAAKIASLVYGCVFQAIQQTYRKWEFCFDPNEYANGKDDFRDVMGVAFRFKIFPPNDTKPIYDCIEQYFENVKNNPEFTELFETDICDLVSSEEDEFQVDVQLVLERVKNFLPKHEKYYQSLVKQLEEIFNLFVT